MRTAFASARWSRFLFFLIVFFPLCVNADTSKQIIIGKGDWCPYVCNRETDEDPLGYAADILKHVYENAGYTPVFEEVNYSRGISLVRQGLISIMACMYKEDAPDLMFPSRRLGLSVNQFFVKQTSEWRFNGLASLGDIRTGLVHGYKYPEFQDYIDEHEEDFIFVAGKRPYLRILKMIQNHRLDATFDDINVIAFQAHANNMDGELKMAGGFGLENDVLVGFSPKDPRAGTLAGILEKGLRDIRKNGTLEKILSRYGMSDWE